MFFSYMVSGTSEVTYVGLAVRFTNCSSIFPPYRAANDIIVVKDYKVFKGRTYPGKAISLTQK